MYSDCSNDDYTQEAYERLKGKRVITPDGPGVVVGREKRGRNKRDRRGVQLRVKLSDGRLRHYGCHKISLCKEGLFEALSEREKINYIFGIKND